jgi:hypothetical protein
MQIVQDRKEMSGIEKLSESSFLKERRFADDVPRSENLDVLGFDQLKFCGKYFLVIITILFFFVNVRVLAGMKRGAGHDRALK